MAIIVFLCITSWLRAESVLTFDEANKLYYQGKFAEAASAYERLIGSDRKSAALYFNLGNAQFKSGQIGRAIAAYRQAEQITPRDPDVQANIRFAQKHIQGPSFNPSRFEEWLRRLTLNEWSLLASAAFWSLFLLLLLREVRPLLRRSLRVLILASLAATILLCACLGYSFYDQRMIKRAIVAVPDAVVRHRPLADSPNAFTLHDGAEMSVLNQKDDWLQVSTDPTRIGWIKRDEVVIR